MIERVKIETIEEYNYVLPKNQPLVDDRFFIIEISLRVLIQQQLFGLAKLGQKDILKANDKFYHWVWENKLHVCEECLKPLYEYQT